jgi:hypothetical protein
MAIVAPVQTCRTKVLHIPVQKSFDRRADELSSKVNSVPVTKRLRDDGTQFSGLFR